MYGSARHCASLNFLVTPSSTFHRAELAAYLLAAKALARKALSKLNR